MLLSIKGLRGQIGLRLRYCSLGRNLLSLDCFSRLGHWDGQHAIWSLVVIVLYIKNGFISMVLSAILTRLRFYVSIPKRSLHNLVSGDEITESIPEWKGHFISGIGIIHAG